MLVNTNFLNSRPVAGLVIGSDGPSILSIKLRILDKTAMVAGRGRRIDVGEIDEAMLARCKLGGRKEEWSKSCGRMIDERMIFILHASS